MSQGSHADEHNRDGHLRAAKDAHAGFVLLRPFRAARRRSPDTSLWPTGHRELSPLAHVHAGGRHAYHRNGEAHSVSVIRVRADRSYQKVRLMVWR